MTAHRITRRGSLLATAGLIGSLILGVGVRTASASACTSGQTPELSLVQTVIPATTTGGSVGFQENVTNTGMCGATDVTVTIRLGSTFTYTGFTNTNRSWTCPAVPATSPFVCTLNAQLDQTSSGGTNGNSGQAGFILYASQSSGGTKNQPPPDVSVYVALSDGAQPAVIDTPPSWSGSINPKTGGRVSIGQESQIAGETVDVTVPAGVGGTVGLLQNVVDSSPVNGGIAHLSVNLPTISNGYNTIVFTILGAGAPPPPQYDEDDTGQKPLAACKGKTANPPCLYSMKGYNLTSSNPYWLITIRDSHGTKYWP